MGRSRTVLVPAAVVAAGVLAATAFGTHRQKPPPILLVGKAGTQRAAQESYCVTSPPHDGETVVVTACADTADLPPRRLSVVRPGQVVKIRLRGATALTDASAAVQVLGRERSIRRFPLRTPSTRWRARLRPGAYELEVFARFQTADGRSGDTSGSLGLLVDRERPLRIVPPRAARPRPSLAG